LTLDNKIKLASLAQQDESNAQRDKDTRLIALKSAIKSMEDARKSKETLLSVDGLQNEMKTSLLIEINELFKLDIVQMISIIYSFHEIVE
jgi:hypothetical protein